MNLVYGLLAALFPPRCERAADLVPGRRARIRGQVIARDILDSTLTGERCVYYRYSVEQLQQTGMAGLGSDGYWALQRQDEAISEFYLQDDSGRVIISPRRARVEADAGAGPEAVDMGIFNQRAMQLLIRPGDTLEVEGLVVLATDIYDHGRDYRASADRCMLCAPEGETLSIRRVESASVRQGEAYRSQSSGRTT